MNHIQLHRNSKCFTCVKGFTTSNHFKEHMLTDHGISFDSDDTKEKAIKNCTIPQQVLHENSRKSLETKGSRKRKSSAKSFTPGMRVKQIKKYFQNKRVHKETTQPEKPKAVATCPHCPASFSTQATLENHKRREHSLLKGYKCSPCKLVFPQRLLLIEHLMLFHNCRSLMQCLFCERGFESGSRFKRHLEYEHGVRNTFTSEETPQGIEEYCPECNDKFDQENCIKVAYVKCGHVTCVTCVMFADELGNGLVLDSF